MENPKNIDQYHKKQSILAILRRITFRGQFE